MGDFSSKKVNVGIFVVVGTVLLVASLYFIGKRQHLFSKNILLYGVFADVSGLQLGNNVRFSGLNVGSVSNIKMIDEGKIAVEMSVEEQATRFIKKNAVATIASDGLVGSMVVNIIPGKNNAEKTVVSGDYIQVKTKISIDQLLETFSKTNESAALITSDLVKITHKIVAGKGTLGALVSDSLLENDMKKSVAGLKKTAEGASHAIAQVNAVISKINYDHSAAAVLLSDLDSRKQIQNVFTNLEKSSKDINQVTESLEQYLNEIKSGKGTLNYLTKDPVLVKNIDSTVVNVKESAQKLNQNMEALKHNFFFRGYFKKLERQEKKEAPKN